MRKLSLLMMFGLMGLGLSAPLRADIIQINLVSDQAGVAKITDPNLVNAWGVSFSATSPFWVSNNGTGTSTLYSAPSNNTSLITKAALTVTIPGDGSVTGQVFNGGAGAGAFNGDNFLFVSEDGTISGWRGALGTTAEKLVVGSTDNVYKGSAFATVGGHSYLYAANFRTGAIDVLKGDSGAPDIAGKFVEPNLPVGYAPFNIQNLGGTLFVTYALQDSAKHDEVAGAGNGFVSRFDLNGNFLGRVGSNGPLDAPWGLAIAPTSFGALAGDLLVGNFGDGKINAFNLATNSFAGALTSDGSKPIVIDGLWALTTGNGGNGGNPGLLYFTAGPGGESHGLFGALAAVPEPSQIAMIGVMVVAGCGAQFRRIKAARKNTAS